MDDATELLQMKSQAPGAYALYDYQSAVNFHGHTLPSKITWSSASTTLTLQLQGFTDADAVNPASIRPTPEMISQGSSWQMQMAPFPSEARLLGRPPSQRPEAAVIEATIGPQGDVQEILVVSPAEDEAFTQRAIGTVEGGHYPHSPGQREIFFVVTAFRLPGS